MHQLSGHRLPAADARPPARLGLADAQPGIEQEPGKVHAGGERQVKRSPEAGVELEQPEVAGQRVAPVLEHRHPVPPDAPEHRERVGLDVREAHALAEGRDAAGVRHLVDPPVGEPGAWMAVHHEEKDAHALPGNVPLHQEPPVVGQPARERVDGLLRPVEPEHPARRAGHGVDGVGLEPQRAAEAAQLLEARYRALDHQARRQVGISRHRGHQIRLAEGELHQRGVEERQQVPELARARAGAPGGRARRARWPGCPGAAPSPGPRG